MFKQGDKVKVTDETTFFYRNRIWTVKYPFSRFTQPDGGELRVYTIYFENESGSSVSTSAREDELAPA